MVASGGSIFSVCVLREGDEVLDVARGCDCYASHHTTVSMYISRSCGEVASLGRGHMEGIIVA